MNRNDGISVILVLVPVVEYKENEVSLRDLVTESSNRRSLSGPRELFVSHDPGWGYKTKSSRPLSEFPETTVTVTPRPLV